MKKLCFRIREKYLHDIEKEIKRVEYRRDSPFWQKRLANIFGEEAVRGYFQITPMHSGIEIEGVFISGKKIHRREIVGIARIKTPDCFSDQGKKDVDTKTCLAFYLGKSMKEEKFNPDLAGLPDHAPEREERRTPSMNEWCDPRSGLNW